MICADVSVDLYRGPFLFKIGKINSILTISYIILEIYKRISDPINSYDWMVFSPVCPMESFLKG